ncbi:unnamed protein product [Dibothriocephalus latus]|uniref:Fibrillar collagen NC1 domain-containing protein n=1 Tax=Dibothriocephalus latus TaxID=60516 RepID=A0A3P7NK53_DIBLA|nr:unnamed protein product [Dibothriocephalus latus]
MRRLYARMETLDNAVKNYRRPIGTQSFPARHCQEIMEISKAPMGPVSGEYWIDPNLGSSRDAFKVDCRFDHDSGIAKTCVPATAASKAFRLSSLKKPESSSAWWMSSLIQEVGNGTERVSPTLISPVRP